MHDLTLLFGRESTAVHIAHAAVHIPLDILNVMLPQQLADNPCQIVHHLRAGKIQHQLVAPHGGLASGQGQRPVRMGAVQLGVLVDHFRFDPQAEFHAQRIDLPDQWVQSAGQLFAVHSPVAQTLIVIVPGAEPAIVQHHHLHAERGRFFSDLYDLFGVEIKIGGLPVIDQHRAAFVLPRAAADVAPQKAVVLLGKRGQTLCREGEDHLRGVKGLARLQVPCKALLLNTAHYPDKPGLRALHVHLVAAGIDHHHPVTGTAGLRCILLAEDQEGIIVVAGAAPHRRNGLDIGAHSFPLQLPFHGVSAVEMQQIPSAKGQIQTGRCRLVQPQRGISVVCQPRRTGDDILLCKHAVQQLQRQTGCLVLHSDNQGLGIVFLCVGTGQTGQLIFARLHRVAHIGKVCAKGATAVGHRQAGETEIAHIAAGILLREQIRGNAPVGAVSVVIRRESPVCARIQLHQVPGADSFAVVQMQQVPQRIHLHVVAGMGGLQCKNAGVRIKSNTHGSYTSTRLFLIKMPTGRRSFRNGYPPVGYDEGEM